MKFVVPLAFAAHGIGMIGGVYFVLTQRGWLLAAIGSGAVGWVARLAVALVWVASGAAFLVAAWALYRGDDAWRSWAWVAAPTTLLGALAWSGGFPAGVWAGALMSVAVVVYLLFA